MMHIYLTGHGRCLVDSGFAHIKIKYRKNDVETLPELAALVNSSSKTNRAVCYPEWPWRRWKPFLERVFKPVVGIRYSIVIVIN